MSRNRPPLDQGQSIERATRHADCVAFCKDLARGEGRILQQAHQLLVSGQAIIEVSPSISQENAGEAISRIYATWQILWTHNIQHVSFFCGSPAGKG